MTVTVDGKKYDISLNDGTDTYGLNVVHGSDTRTIRSEWAAVSPTAGQTPGSTSWQLVAWEDWSKGVGLERWVKTQPARYYLGSGIETRWAGRVQLSGQWDTQDTTKTATANPIDFGANVYVPCGVKLRKYDVLGGTWSDVNLVDYGSNITHLHVSNGYLFVALGTSTDAIRYDAALAATTLTNVKAQCFGSALAKLWYGAGNMIYASVDNGATWVAGTVVGDSTGAITSLTTHKDLLYIGKDDSFWSYDNKIVGGVATLPLKVLDVSLQKYAGNFTFMTEWRGDLYYSVLKRVYRYTSGRHIEITPPLSGDADKEYYGWGVPTMFSSLSSGLLVGFNLSEGANATVMLYDGVGWHPMYTGSHLTMRAVGYSRNKSWIILNDGTTRSMSVFVLTDHNTASYVTAGSIEFPWFDGGYPLFKKSGSAVVVSTRDCTATETVTVKYRTTDGAAWTTAGSAITSSTTPTTIALAAAGAVEFYKIQFRVELVRGMDTTKTPALTGLGLRNVAVAVSPGTSGTRKGTDRVTVWLSKRQRSGT